jgi:ElaB/YqjD/DUF883 family membrane-anchored ribosome-binding protein
MSETINTIQEKLSPGHLRREAQDKIREATVGKVEEMANMTNRKVRSWRASAVETVKQNPVPTALVGIGLGWLLMSGTENTGPEYYPREFEGSRPYRRSGQGQLDEVRHRVDDVARDVQERAAQVGEEVQEKAREMTDQARERTDELTTEAEQRAQEMRRRAKRGFQQTLDENPLAVAATALAVGAAVGLTLPSTRTEDKMMGRTRDRFMHEAEATARETVDRVRHVAEEATQAAKEEAEREAEKQDLPKPTGSPVRESE